jgi:two-component system cell cycle response regulator
LDLWTSCLAACETAQAGIGPVAAMQSRLILIDPDRDKREQLADQLTRQGYSVTIAVDPAEGAVAALSNPPAAVLADLWMPGISGVQLCRLLRAEAATEHVPVVLRGPDNQRSRFWAERAGASGYVAKGPKADLLGVLSAALASAPPDEGFFFQVSDEGDIRDRIAAHLDQALFESVVAADVRALSVCGEFPRLFDLFSQFLRQVMNYRWVALATESPRRLAIHCHPALAQQAELEARGALGLTGEPLIIHIDDDSATTAEVGPAPQLFPIALVNLEVGRLALAPRTPLDIQDQTLMSVVVRELGGPIRITALVEEAQRLATVDPLTGLLNRRAFLGALDLELERSRRLSYPVSVLLLDIDHFKQLNDRHGHAFGDAVLAAFGNSLSRLLRKVDLVSRWGGEEFVATLSGTDPRGAETVAERLRSAVAAIELRAADGTKVNVTASFGVATWNRSEGRDSVIDRADRAMYDAKHSGRNRVRIAGIGPVPPPEEVQAQTALETVGARVPQVRS